MRAESLFLLFVLPVLLFQIKVESGIYLESTESIVDREIVAMIIVVFSNKRSTYVILACVVDNPCPNQKIQIEFTVPCFCFICFCVHIGGFVGNGRGERQACQTVAGKYPVIGITETDIGIGVFDVVEAYQEG